MTTEVWIPEHMVAVWREHFWDSMVRAREAGVIIRTSWNPQLPIDEFQERVNRRLSQEWKHA